MSVFSVVTTGLHIFFYVNIFNGVNFFNRN